MATLLSNYWALVINTRTGAVLDELPICDFSWTDSLDLTRTGSMTITVALLGGSQTDERTLRVKARGFASAPWDVSLALVRDGRPIWAGPLISYTTAADAVTFTCTSIWALLAKRLVIATGYEMNTGDPNATITLALSTPAVALSLLQLATSMPGGDLPFTLPSIALTGDVPRRFLATDLATVTERLVQLSQEAAGPDLRAYPTLDDAQTQLSWVFDIGNPRLGVLSTPWVWDYPATVLTIEEDSDASAMSFRTYVPGQAPTGALQPGVVVVAPTGIYQDLTLLNQGWPLLASVDRTNTSLTEQALLNRQAKGLVLTTTAPAITWKVTVDSEAYPPVGQWQFGDNAAICVTGHNWIPDGTYPRRLIGVRHKPNTAELEITADVVTGS